MRKKLHSFPFHVAHRRKKPLSPAPLLPLANFFVPAVSHRLSFKCRPFYHTNLLSDLGASRGMGQKADIRGGGEKNPKTSLTMQIAKISLESNFTLTII